MLAKSKKQQVSKTTDFCLSFFNFDFFIFKDDEAVIEMNTNDYNPNAPPAYSDVINK